MPTQVTLTGTFEREPGVPSQGNLEWQLSANLFDSSSGGLVCSTAPIPVSLNAAGHFTVVLWANDDVTVSPQGTVWTVMGTVDAQPFGPAHYQLSYDDTDIDITDLTQAQPATAYVTYASQAALEGLGASVTAAGASVTAFGAIVTSVESTVAGMSGTVTTLDGNVTILQGDVTTIDGNVTSLQSEVGDLTVSSAAKSAALALALG